MKFIQIPTINSELISLDITFKSFDTIPGEMHYIEHMMFNDSKNYKGSVLRRELEKAGVGDFFHAYTTIGHVGLSGTYLKKDESRILELLGEIINNASFTEEDMEKERKVILEEYQMGKQDFYSQAFQSLSDHLGHNISVIGTEDTINYLSAEHLQRRYRELVCSSNTRMISHNVSQKSIEYSDLFESSEGKFSNHTFQEKDVSIENSEMTSSTIFTLFNLPPTFKSYFLSMYLNNSTAPLFGNVREKLGLCYSIGASDYFYSKRLCPKFWIHAASTKNLDTVQAAIMDNIVVDSNELYEITRKSLEKTIIVSKSSINSRMWIEDACDQWGMNSDDIMENIPTFGELSELAQQLPSMISSTFKVKGTKEES